MKINKKVLFVSAVAVLGSVMLSSYRPVWSEVAEEVEDVQRYLRLFSDGFALIKDNYVEEISAQKLIYGALDGMVNKLDPYSQFMEPDVAEVVKSDTEGEFGGLGIRITAKGKYVTVVTPLPDTPAFRAGIMPGDKIVKIDGENAAGITLRDAVNRLRGEKGSEVTLSIGREGEEELIDITLVRDIIVPRKIFSRTLEGDVGYIRLVEFSDDAPGKLRKVLGRFKKDKIKGLIFDLRNNPGGLLSAAVEITEFFVPNNQLIVYTKGRRSEQNREFYSGKDPIFEQVPMIVLINKGSASGSEIVAGCLKDIERALVVGEQSFGKASVQSIIDMEDGSALRLTTAKYYTPSGISIHDKGITPDISVPLTREERLEVMKSQEKIYNLPEEQKKEKDGEEFEDPQLRRAQDILIAREIFMKNEMEYNGEEKKEKPEK